MNKKQKVLVVGVAIIMLLSAYYPIILHYLSLIFYNVERSIRPINYAQFFLNSFILIFIGTCFFFVLADSKPDKPDN